MPEKPQADSFKEGYTPYSAFPSYERTKIEIIDAWLAATNSWRVLLFHWDYHKAHGLLCDILRWYILIHGYRNKQEKLELENIKNKLEGIEKFAEGKQAIEPVLNPKELNQFMLWASEYMEELKITGILQHHQPDENFLVEGAVDR